MQAAAADRCVESPKTVMPAYWVVFSQVSTKAQDFAIINIMNGPGNHNDVWVLLWCCCLQAITISSVTCTQNSMRLS